MIPQNLPRLASISYSFTVRIIVRIVRTSSFLTMQRDCHQMYLTIIHSCRPGSFNLNQCQAKLLHIRKNISKVLSDTQLWATSVSSFRCYSSCRWWVNEPSSHSLLEHLSFHVCPYNEILPSSDLSTREDNILVNVPVLTSIYHSNLSIDMAIVFFALSLLHSVENIKVRMEIARQRPISVEHMFVYFFSFPALYCLYPNQIDNT